MNTLAFKIEPCLTAKDHQVRIIIDGKDWFDDDDILGIDPPGFFSQRGLLQGGNIIIARCGCGTVGCDDFEVAVERKSPAVFWHVREGFSFSFREGDYDRIIRAAASDHSWEDINRRVERLVSEILAETMTTEDFVFEWASARIAPEKITLSYIRNREQRLFDFVWDGKSPENALSGAIKFKNEHLRLSVKRSTEVSGS